MISVVIPTLNAEARLAASLTALASARATGLVSQLIVVDSGSVDATLDIAQGFDAEILTAPRGRGSQLKAGGEYARGVWILFLHADSVLDKGWEEEVVPFVKSSSDMAGVFTLGFSEQGWRPELVAWGAMMRTRWSRLPFGDQGFLVSRAVYDEIGGYKDMPLFEDVDIIERLHRTKGRHAMHIFKSRAVTSPERYERDGYLRRVVKNFVLVMRYRLGASPEKLARAYR